MQEFAAFLSIIKFFWGLLSFLIEKFHITSLFLIGLLIVNKIPLSSPSYILPIIYLSFRFAFKKRSLFNDSTTEIKIENKNFVNINNNEDLININKSKR